jgi:hypothetical protein
MFHEQSTFNARQPVSAYLVLDSNDRSDANANVNTTITTADIQPWNNFRLQKPAPLMDGYAKRLGITEINFPWAIPNITPRNNSFVIAGAGMPAGAYTVTVTPGFYTATELVTAINTDLSNNVVNPPVLSWSTSQLAFTLTPNASNNNLQVYTTSGGSFSTYVFSANLLKTMGISFPQFNTVFTAAAPLVGSTTKLQYTAFVDITSSKLNYTSEVKDGSSARKNVSDLITRLYCADETSAINMASIGTPGSRPFQIHRQYATAKYLKQNPNQMLDWIDVQVYDEYGDLVYIPDGARTYPDFQITLLASEN